MVPQYPGSRLLQDQLSPHTRDAAVVGEEPASALQVVSFPRHDLSLACACIAVCIAICIAHFGLKATARVKRQENMQI